MTQLIGLLWELNEYFKKDLEYTDMVGDICLLLIIAI